MASVASVLPPLLLPGPGGSVGRAEPRMLLSFRSLGSGSWVGRRQERPASRGSSVLVRSFEVSGPGAVDSPLISSMKLKIQQQLSTDDVVVRDERGDGRHVSIQVVAAAFEGQSRVNRQRMVYKAIWEELQGVVHAVDQLTTKTPAEAAKDTLSP